MRLAIASALVESDGLATSVSPIPPDMYVGWLNAYGRCFPDEDTFFVNIYILREFLDITDVDMVLLHIADWPKDTDYIYEFLSDRPDGCPPIVMMECEPGFHWVHMHPMIVNSYVRVIRAADAVATKHPMFVSHYRQWTEGPVRFIPEPNCSSGHASAVPTVGGKDLILMPRCITTAGGWARNTVTCYALMKMLQPSFPDYQYGIVTGWRPPWQEEHGGRTVTISELDVQETLGCSVDLLAPEGPLPASFGNGQHYRDFLAGLMERAALFINLDACNGVGHFVADACAYGVPTITSNATAAGHAIVRDRCVSSPYDLDDAFAKASLLLSDPDEWLAASADNSWFSMEFAASTVAVKLQELREEIA